MKKALIPIVAILAFVWALYIYVAVYGLDADRGVYHTLALFFGNISTADNFNLELKNLSWYQNIYYPATVSALVLVWAVVVLYLKAVGYRLSFWFRKNFSDDILVIGLGEGSCAYIDSELKDNKKIIAIEKNSNNPKIKEYEKRVLIAIGDGLNQELLESLKIKNREHIVISTGDNLQNIKVAKLILKIDRDANIYLHITDRKLKDLNKEKGIVWGKNLKTFSYYEESVRDLLQEYKPYSKDTILSKKSFALSVVGDGKMALELINQLCMVNQLPNENRLTIYCIDKDANSLKDTLYLEYGRFDNIPNIELIFIDSSVESLSFYELELWHKEELENIYITYDDNKTNLDIALKLTNIAYLQEVADESFKKQIYVASSGGEMFGLLEERSIILKHIKSFAQNQKVGSKEFIINKSRKKQAMGVDFIYNHIVPTLENYDNFEYSYTPSVDEFLEINSKSWQKLSNFHKESNRAVSDHIATKLNYLGLDYKKSNINNKERLFQKNLSIFKKHFTKEKRLPLIVSEHNRWMAFHILNGYKKMPFVDVETKKANKELYQNQKLHMCLVELKEFKQRANELEKLGYMRGGFEAYDTMIVEFIPHILSNAGKEIFEI